VYENASRVALISNQESSFDAEIIDRDASGVVKGQGGRNLSLDLVAQDKEIKEGDLVVSASLGGIYPKGLSVGQIQEIKRSDTDPFYQIAVAPFFDVKKINSVLIILDF
ncbi:MAG: rod shape-determining protein MreC, partial [bacterium]|nr:rod shape-determining protein MreC [bacterium]